MKKIFTLIVMMCAALGMQAEDTYTIAGDMTLTGYNWDPAATENDMTSTDGENFTLVKEKVMLAAGVYEYKVVMNHAWNASDGGGAYPEDNATIDIEEDGEYTVTFTFNTDELVPNALAQKTGAYEAPATVWVVAGVEDLMGSNWNNADKNNQMTTTDGKNYTLVKKDVALNVDTPYEYKFVKNASSWYGDPENNDANFRLFVDEPGKYTVTFTLNDEDIENLVTNVTVEKTGSASFADKTWTICGVAALCGSAWDPTDESNDMEEVDEGYFELVRKSVSLEIGNYEYKVAANHSWGESYGKDGGSSNNVFTVTEDGVYDVTFTFLVETKTLDAVGTAATDGVKLVKVGEISSAVIYNLQGQRVEAGFRGIAIKNGRKVVMK